MEFFNQKEEVLEVILTKKGKELLSQGKFKPYGYKFFDEKTLYEAPIQETQNGIVDRIKNTPYPKSPMPVQIYTKGKPNNPIPNIIAPYGFFNKADLNNELGQSDQFSEYAPSWNIQFLESSGTYAASYLSASINNSAEINEFTPQFSVNVNYKLALIYAYYDSKIDKYFYTDDYKDKFNFVQLVLQKDTDDVFIKAIENNSFLETQKQELSLELYEYLNVNGIGQELKPINMEAKEEDSYSKYFTISFDDVAEQESAENTKNIYKAETEDVC
jgi:hypothetical protein